MRVKELIQNIAAASTIPGNGDKCNREERRRRKFSHNHTGSKKAITGKPKWR